MEVRLTEQDAVCRMDRGADDGKVGKPDIRQARCGCVGVQDAGGRSFGVPESGGLFRITGAGGKMGERCGFGSGDSGLFVECCGKETGAYLFILYVKLNGNQFKNQIKNQSENQSHLMIVMDVRRLALWGQAIG